MKRKARNKKRLQDHLKQVNLYAAGIDIGSTSHFVAVPPSLDDKPIREYSCFTVDLEHMADWLKEVGISTIAMESTRVYWIPAFELLEAVTEQSSHEQYLAQSYLTMGLIQLESDETESAREYLEKVAQQYPNSSDAQTASMILDNIQ